MSPTDTILAAAIEVAELAGRHALSRFHQSGLAVETKRDGSPVTAADREAERLAREWIEARFPEDGITGEEFGTVRPEARRRWFLDPIDGTRSFIHGVPLWGTIVAVLEGDEVLAGVLNCAAAGELVAAAPGEGCWWNGTRCRVSAVSDLGLATVLTTDTTFSAMPSRKAGWESLAARAGLVRTWGDAYGYVLVATGRAEVMVDPVLHPWDGAALVPIIEEAGGVVTDYSGKRSVVGDSAIATNRTLAEEVRDILSS